MQRTGNLDGCFSSASFHHRHADLPLATRPSLNALMPKLIPQPTRIQAAGNKPKTIDEFVGRVSSGHSQISVAHMKSPSGWVEPGQTPDFEEYTIILKGMLRVESREGTMEVTAGQAIITHPGEWVRYSSPGPDGAEYIAICTPAFSPETVHRDE
jgi:mannose-6-phosphate isomerase-like protein (cupin superfamily)